MDEIAKMVFNNRWLSGQVDIEEGDLFAGLETVVLVKRCCYICEHFDLLIGYCYSKEEDSKPANSCEENFELKGWLIPEG